MRGAHPPSYDSQSLEDALGCELHVEGFAGSDTRGAIEVTDGVAHDPVPTDRPAAGGQVDPVKQVKHLRPKLYFQALANRNVLEHRKIHGTVSRRIKLVPRHVAEEGGRAGAIEGRRIDPLFPSSRRGELVRHTGKRIRYQVASRTGEATRDVERLPGVERQ